jgi:hypothetical protein
MREIGIVKAIKKHVYRDGHTRAALPGRLKYAIRKQIALLKQYNYHLSDPLFRAGDTNAGNNWIFHDENWIRVVNRREHRAMLAKNLPLSVVDNHQEISKEVSFEKDGLINFEGHTSCNDEWLYLYLDPARYCWNNYTWQLKIKRDTPFKEFQFGFRYQDFYNRYRYRIQDDKVYFDKVINGRFYNSCSVAPFKMELGVWYDIRIDVFGNMFKLHINKKMVLADFDFDNNFSTGSIAIILWENDFATDIRASVGQINVHKLTSRRI